MTRPAPGWRFHLRKVEHRSHLTYEGSVSAPGETEAIHSFLLLGRDQLTVELQSLSPLIPGDIMTALAAHIGMPVSSPVTQARTGEIEEPSGEIILTATWRFPPEERETVRAKIEAFLAR